jgi:hypothetical protein
MLDDVTGTVESTATGVVEEAGQTLRGLLGGGSGKPERRGRGDQDGA